MHSQSATVAPPDAATPDAAKPAPAFTATFGEAPWKQSAAVSLLQTGQDQTQQPSQSANPASLHDARAVNPAAVREALVRYGDETLIERRAVAELEGDTVAQRRKYATVLHNAAVSDAAVL